MTPPRSIEEQFEPDLAKRLRELQQRLEAVRTTSEASDYFIYEARSCLDRGLLLATLQLATAALELRCREILIQRTIDGLSDRRGPAHEVEISVEGDRGYVFYGILAALETKGVIAAEDRLRLQSIYREIRIPLHHGIVRRYSHSREGGGNKWILEAFFGDSQVHLTTSESAMESVIEMYGVDDLDHVVSALELLTPKFRKAGFPVRARQRPNQVELTASQRTTLLSMATFSSPAATRASARSSSSCSR